MDKLYTTIEAADILGCAKRTVQKWAQYLNIPRFGYYRLITEKDLERIRALVHDGPGRPKKEGV